MTPLHADRARGLHPTVAAPEPTPTPVRSAAYGPLQWSDPPPPAVSVVIVGGGFSGLMTAIHTLTNAPAATAAIVERLPRPRPGIAYGGADEAHLLNVRADRMGVTARDPGGFMAWLTRRCPGEFAPGDYVPRHLFGDYLNEFVSTAIAPLRERLSLVCDGVASVHRTGTGMIANLDSGEAIRAEAVVLALGLPAPGAPWPTAAAEGIVVDPWSPRAYDGVEPGAPVVVAGSGLTALDVLGSLSRRGHQGSVTVVSRNGRFPLPHGEPSSGGTQVAIEVAELKAGPRRALREIRGAARRARLDGRSWQEAIDAVRPHTTAAWQAWSDADRERFLAHLRPFWEVHRHRAPASALALLDDGLRCGRMQTVRGTITGVEGLSPPYSVTIRAARGDVTSRPAARIFNCIGPAMRLHDSADPLLCSLRHGALVSSDAAGLGLRADAHGRALDAAGIPQQDLYVLGALRRGDLWESTAVPDLRVQAETVAAALAAVLFRPGI